MSLEEWEAFEADFAEQEQARVNRIRVRGYFLARMKAIDSLKEELERRVTLMMRARVEAQTTLRDLHRECAHAETIAAVMVAGPDAEDELAQLIEAQIG